MLAVTGPMDVPACEMTAYLVGEGSGECSDSATSAIKALSFWAAEAMVPS